MRDFGVQFKFLSLAIQEIRKRKGGSAVKKLGEIGVFFQKEKLLRLKNRIFIFSIESLYESSTKARPKLNLFSFFCFFLLLCLQLWSEMKLWLVPERIFSSISITTFGTSFRIEMLAIVSLKQIVNKTTDKERTR